MSQHAPVEAQIQTVSEAVGKVIPAMATMMAMLVPGAAPVIAGVEAVAKGIIALEPGALALWEQFQSGTPPTPDQLDAYAATEQTAYEKAMADMQAKLVQP